MIVLQVSQTLPHFSLLKQIDPASKVIGWASVAVVFLDA